MSHPFRLVLDKLENRLDRLERLVLELQKPKYGTLIFYQGYWCVKVHGKGYVTRNTKGDPSYVRNNKKLNATKHGYHRCTVEEHDRLLNRVGIYTYEDGTRREDNPPQVKAVKTVRQLEPHELSIPMRRLTGQGPLPTLAEIDAYETSRGR